MFCKHCGKEILKGATICVGCGIKIKKPWYKKWWLWVIVGLLAIMLISCNSDDSTTTSSSTTTVEQTAIEEEITYNSITANQLIQDLEANAMVAEDYTNGYFSITGYICNFDSDGNYISIDNNDTWNFTTIQCYTRGNEEVINQLKQYREGDMIVVNGQITDVGEVLGYQMNIHSIG